MGSVVSTSQARVACPGPRGEGGCHGEDGSRTVFHTPERGRLGNRRLMLVGLVGACALLALIAGALLGGDGGPVLGAHLGRGCVGVAYIAEE